MPPLPMIPNQPAGVADINWGQLGYQNDRDVTNELKAQASARIREVEEREYQLKVRALNQKREEIRISKGESAANKWYQQQSIKLAKQKLQEDQRQFDLDFGEKQRQFNLNYGLETDKFRDSSLQSWTDKALTLSRTPKDYFTLMRMQQGVGDNLSSIPGLSWLTGGQVGTQTFNGNPEANSLRNVLGNMNIGLNGADDGNWALQAANQANQMIADRKLNLTPQQQQLYQTALDFGKNPQGAAAGWYENLDPLTRDLIQGAGEDQGLDWASVLSRYKRSQWGGGGSSLAA